MGGNYRWPLWHNYWTYAATNDFMMEEQHISQEWRTWFDWKLTTKVPKVNNVICKIWSTSVKFSQTVHFLSQIPIFLFFNPPSLKNSKSKIDVVSVEVGTVCGANLDKWEAGLVLSNMMLLQNKQMLIMSNMMFLQNKQMLELWESTRAYSFCLL